MEFYTEGFGLDRKLNIWAEWIHDFNLIIERGGEVKFYER